VRDHRSGHECLDAASRREKAEKIARLVSSERPLAGTRILDVGAGSGVIAADLAARAGQAGEVWGVDVRDSRILSEGYRFVLTKGTALPCETDYFDVVISNHVIEHVGSREDQLHHLREIARVLRPDGVGYLATPNRWTLVEPHFRLPFLSWLPAGLQGPYVRAARRGTAYDCELLTRGRLADLIVASGLQASDRTMEAIKLTGEIESLGVVARGFIGAPERLHRMLRTAVPTLIVTLRKPRTGNARAAVPRD
jgi:2-polyprenyl-3-methyl-5-hydroxy-6-metoxy-1,4-benzoquinol methylase